MERESFEDPAIAALMNEHFVCIKVDREERPDVDAICMEACQAMTGQGGWPLNAFLTPEQEPFYVGTYFPPEPRHGHAELARWCSRRSRRPGASAATRCVEQGAAGLAARSAAPRRLPASPEPITAGGARRGGRRRCAERSTRATAASGGAPKFPPGVADRVPAGPRRARDVAGDAAGDGAGGIYDQVGGGFARYAVDATWTVPHFEKMLYDNALLARAYLHGWQVSGEPLLRRVCERDPGLGAARDARPEGGFCAALDADSEGVEGKFYVWTVGRAARRRSASWPTTAIAFFGATEAGNFEGANVLEGRGPEPEPRCPRSAASCTARARSGSGPGSTTSG